MEKRPLSLQRGLLSRKPLQTNTSKGKRGDGGYLCMFWKDAIMKGAPEPN